MTKCIKTNTSWGNCFWIELISQNMQNSILVELKKIVLVIGFSALLLSLFSGLSFSMLIKTGLLESIKTVDYENSSTPVGVSETNGSDMLYKTQVEPIADTYVDRLYHWKNFGDQNMLCVLFNWTYPSGQTCYISFLKFNLSNIPSSAKIVSAELYLRVEETSVGTTMVTRVKAHRYLNNTWDEPDLTWDNVDWELIQNATSENEIYVDLLETQVWFNWTITEDVEKSKGGFLTEALSASGGESIFFYSRETLLKPYLNITYAFSTFVGGIISENTTWTLENSPYIVTENILVDVGATLTIEPGVTVKFDGKYYLLVKGTLSAIGTADNYISFTSNQPVPAPGDWGLIDFYYANDASILRYCIIEYAGGASVGADMTRAGIEVRQCSPAIVNNIIRENGVHGIALIDNGSPNISHNLIILTDALGYHPETQGAGAAIYASGNNPTPTITYNALTLNNYGIFLFLHPYPTISNNNIFGNNVYDIAGYNEVPNVDASNNWWGTTNTTLIDEHIYDFYDDFSLGKVNYIPILTEPHPAVGTYVGGHISENTTWAFIDVPYIVVEDIVVQEGVFLTIEPGVVVKFADGTALIVDGALIARGNITHRITFTSNSSTPNPGDWKGIKFRDTSIDSECTFDYVIVEYGGSSNDFAAIHAETVSLNFRNCISRFNNYPLISNNSTFQNCTIINNEYWVDCNELIMKNCIVANNTYGVNAGDGILENITIANNTYGMSLKNRRNLTIKNCTITKNQEYGLYSSEGSAKIYNSTISYNKFGIKILTSQWYFVSRPSIEIYNSSITYNQVAVETGKEPVFELLQFGLILRITACKIFYNNYGIRSAGTLEVYQSAISHNNGTGVNHILSTVYPEAGGAHLGTLRIISSTIVSNNGNGIWVSPYKEDISEYEVVAPVINFCNLYNNTSYDVVSNLPYGDDVNATYNWWGTTNETVIQEHVYDYYDDYELGKVLHEPFLLSPYFVAIEGQIFYVEISSNSTITNFNFDRLDKCVSFDVTGPNQTIGFCNVAIPKELLWGEFSVFKDGSLLVKDVDYTETFNGTHYIFYITYVHTNHTIEIRGTEIIPEFPTWTVLLLVFVAVTVSINLYIRKRLRH